MKATCKVISYVGLLATVVPSILVFNGTIELKTHMYMMIVGMILWFATAPVWLKK